MPNEITSVTEVSLSKGRRVKVWRKETGVLKEYEHGDVVGTIVMQSSLTHSKFAEYILNNLPRTVAVEVIDSGGNGVSIKKV